MSEDTNNPHLIDRYIVSKIKGRQYLVTNGDNSFSISGKSEADTLCDTLNTKVDSIMEAMCTLTGDWSGYVKVIEKPEDILPYVGKKNSRIQSEYDDKELEHFEPDKSTVPYLRKNILDFEESYKGKKVIAWGDICKRLGIAEDSYM